MISNLEETEGAIRAMNFIKNFNKDTEFLDRCASGVIGTLFRMIDDNSMCAKEAYKFAMAMLEERDRVHEEYRKSLQEKYHGNKPHAEEVESNLLGNADNT